MNKVIEKYNKTKNFLTDYAKGKYGKCSTRIEISEDVVNLFLVKSKEEDLDEILSYLRYEAEMLENMYGAEDLEDYIDYVIDK